MSSPCISIEPGTAVSFLRWFILVSWSWLALVALMQPAAAQNIIERLVNPGPLSESHAKLETTCTSCHTPFSRETQNGLCLDCHKPVAADIAAHAGFHGRSPEVATSQCRRCHTDHVGRDASIIFFDATLFDHALSEFPLTGGHVGLACASCHTEKAKFRAAAVACNACHGKDDPHKGELGTSCGKCHETANWKKAAAFDHAATKFPLTGQHAKAECRSCHAGAQYTGLALTCIGCHKTDDVHKGSFGANCADCHKTGNWAAATFNHDKTKFPLRGAHRQVACKGCHSDEPTKDHLPLTCIGCHQKDDVHKGSFGTDCAKCHNEANWKQASNFDHDKTRFPLIGRHKAVGCSDCHKSSDFKAAPMQCQSCHQDTFHQRRLGPDCASCHSPRAWLQWHFDHSLQTHFPLTGAHIKVECHACHSQPVSAKPILDAACITCHRKDDVHRGSFGPNCQQCHSTTTFRR